MRKAFGVMWAVAVVGCGQTSTTGGSSSSSGSQATSPGRIEATADGYKIVISEFEVQPGEVQRCVVVAGLPEDMIVSHSEVRQQAGGHHMVLYTRDSARPGDTFDCTAAEAMGNARFIAPGNFEGGAQGLAYRVPANKPFIVQSHYINATPDVIRVSDEYTMVRAPAASTPKFIDFFALTEVGFLLPRGQSTVVVDCNIPRDMQVIRHFGHMHELGTHYSLERIRNGQAEMVDTYEWDIEYRDNAPLRDATLAAPYMFLAGDQLRLTCTYDNTRDHDVEFPEEMCVTFIHYVVDSNWNGFLTCGEGSQPEVVQ